MVAFISWVLAFCALQVKVDAAATASQNITNDAFFYGQSEPVYPTRRSIPIPMRYNGTPPLQLLGNAKNTTQHKRNNE